MQVCKIRQPPQTNIVRRTRRTHEGQRDPHRPVYTVTEADRGCPSKRQPSFSSMIKLREARAPRPPAPRVDYWGGVESPADFRISQLRSRISRVRFGWLCAALSGSFLSVSFLDTLHGETYS